MCGLHGVIYAPADGEYAINGGGVGNGFGRRSVAQNAACALQCASGAVFDAGQKQVLAVLMALFLKFFERFKGGAIKIIAGFKAQDDSVHRCGRCFKVLGHFEQDGFGVGKKQGAFGAHDHDLWHALRLRVALYVKVFACFRQVAQFAPACFGKTPHGQQYG